MGNPRRTEATDDDRSAATDAVMGLIARLVADGLTVNAAADLVEDAVDVVLDTLPEDADSFLEAVRDAAETVATDDESAALALAREEG